MDSNENIIRHIKSEYGAFFEKHRQTQLDPSFVPIALRPFMPYAELWGCADDLDREALIRTAPEIARTDLLRIAVAIDDLLDEWLAGDEAHSTSPSREYVAFSAMRMAADFIRA